MKTYLKLFLFISILLSGFISNAQADVRIDSTKKSNLTPEQRAEKRTTEMTDLLQLSDEQAKKIYEINLAHIRQMDIYRAEIKVLKEKIKAEREASKAKIDAVLNAEQRQKYDEHLKERHENKQNQKKEHGDGAPSGK